MSVYLKSIEVKGLFDEKDIRWDLSDVSVLVGKNGAGKSTILRSVYDLLTDENKGTLNLSTEFILNFIDDASIRFKKNSPFSEREMSIFLENINKTKHLKIKKTSRSNKDDSFNKYLAALHEIYKEVSINKGRVSTIFTSEITKENEEAIADISVEMISTINMSANSINELKKSDGNTTTLLDLELNVEMEKIKLAKNNKEMEFRKIKFIEQLNDFFSESNKSVSFNDEHLIVKNLKSDKIISINSLSSGERQLLFILIKALNISNGKNILLMDEPEISLHMSWQKKLITSIKTINENCQMIIVTHSASILAKGWLDSFVDIKNIESEVS